MVFLVVEGVDGAGKTTFVDMIAELAERRGYNTKIWHSGPPERHPLEEYELTLETDYDSTLNELVIADRWHLGELIYGPLYRGEESAQQFSLGAAWHVSAKLHALGSAQIVLSPPLSVVRLRLTDRGEDFLQSHHVAHVHSAYAELADSNHPLGRDIKTISEVPNTVHAKRLLTLLELRRWQGLALQPFRSYVGSHFPSFLLLTSGSLDDRHDAALVPYPDTDGRWLCDAVAASSPISGYDTHNIGIADTTTDNISELWDTLSRPPVVAFGDDAHRAAERFGVPHGTVPSIAHARRFTNSAARYIDLIVSASITNRKVTL